MSSPPGFTLPFSVAVLVVTLVAGLVDAVGAVGATVAATNLAAFVNVLAALPAEPPVLEPVVVELLELVVAPVAFVVEPVAEVDEPLVELPAVLLPELLEPAFDVPGAGQLRI